MIAATPRGARPPWKTRRSLETIGDLLADGISFDDLAEHIDGAAALIARGLQSPRWWTVGNLFGDKTIERWRVEIGAMHDRDARAAAEEAAEAKRAAEHAAALAEPQPVAVLSLERVAAQARRALVAQWEREQASSSQEEVRGG